MPEGDTIAHAANRLRPILLDQIPEIEPRHPPLRPWAQRLEGRRVTAVDSYGKHLFVRFGEELTIHSHLRMTGAWHTGPVGARWRRSPRRAWLVLRAGDREAVQFDGPILDLWTGLRARIDRSVAQLGPDILAERFDDADYLRRLRHDDPTRPFGDALLDQRIVAGMGTIWRAESLFDARVSPLTPTSAISDQTALEVIAAARPRMAASARGGGAQRERHVYRRTRCISCAGPIQSGGLGDDNRRLYWCPSCQR